MAIKKIRDDKTNNKYDDIIDDSNDQDSMMIFLKKLSEKIDESVDKTNEHITKMGVNDAKIGITTAQAKAITDNTSKIGINQVLQSAVKNLSISTITFTLMQGKSGYSLRLETSLSNKEKHYVDLPLTKGK